MNDVTAGFYNFFFGQADRISEMYQQRGIRSRSYQTFDSRCNIPSRSGLRSFTGRRRGGEELFPGVFPDSPEWDEAEFVTFEDEFEPFGEPVGGYLENWTVNTGNMTRFSPPRPENTESRFPHWTGNRGNWTGFPSSRTENTESLFPPWTDTDWTSFPTQGSNEDNIDLDNMTYEEIGQLGDTIGGVNQGLSQDQMSLLPSHKYKGSSAKGNKSPENPECAICKMEYIDGEMVITLPCAHQYHKKCIKSWLKDHKSCCICKMEVKL